MCLLKFYSIMSTDWDTCTSSLTAAILDFRLPITSGSIGTSSTELLELKNLELPLKCCCYHEYGLRYTLFLIYFRLMAATFDLWYIQTSLVISFTNVDTCISGLTAAILNFWVIAAWNFWYPRPLKKTSLSSPNKKPNTQRYFIQPYYVLIQKLISL